jgi:hypothetical protein
VKARKVNDAQVERLLDAMKRDPKYRAQLAERVVAKEGVNKFTPTGKISAEYARRYKSTMRRFQRYVTDAGEKRSFAKAPVEYQREVRREARAVPPPTPPPREPRFDPGIPSRELERLQERGEDYDEDEDEDERDYSLTPGPGREDQDREHDRRARSLEYYQRQYLLKTIVAYHDGDSDNAADHLGLSRRGADLLSLATDGEGVAIGNMRGAGELKDAVADFLDSLPNADLQDIRDFHDLISNMPDWEAGILLADMEDGDTTFSDWVEIWRDNGMDYDDLLTDRDFWIMWRAAYAKSKA